MNFLNKTIEYGLYLLVFLLPIQTRWIIKAGQLNGGPWEYGTYSLYATDILLIIVLLLFIVREIASSPEYGLLAMTEKRIHNGKKIWWFIGGLLFMAVVSSVFASDKALALYKFSWLILGVGLFWLATSARYDRAKLIYAMLAGAFFQAGLGIWQFLNQTSFAGKWLGLALHDGALLGTAVVEAVGADGAAERWLRAYGGFDHPNILGGMLAIVIMLVIFLLVAENLSAKDKIPLTLPHLVRDRLFVKGGKISIFPPSPRLRRTSGFRFSNNIKKIISWVFLIVFITALFFSFSRSAWLALATGLAVMVIWAVVGKNLKLQKGLAEIILVMGIIIFLFFNQYQNLVIARLGGEGRLEAKSNFERLASYQEARQVIKNNWLFGVGPGNYTLALHDKITPGQAGYYYQPAHNVFILVWAETGIMGIIFFAGLIIFTLLRLPRLERWATGDNDKIVILIALIIIMSFDHWLWSLHFGSLFFWLAIGLVSGSKKIID